jgi:hypothetical protein
MVVAMAMALGEFSTSLLTMNVHRLHSTAREIELMLLPADVDESCASVAAAVVLSTQIRCRECPAR